MRHLLVIGSLLFTISLSGQGVERQGFVIGLGFGGGMIDIEDSGTETGFSKSEGVISLPNLKLGFMLSDRAALLATFSGGIYEFEDRDRSFEAIMPSIQYWVSDRWWVNAGAGLAMDMPALYDLGDRDDTELNLGYAFSASTGIELVQKRNYALDLNTRVQYGRVSLDGGGHRKGGILTLGLGFSWY